MSESKVLTSNPDLRDNKPKHKPLIIDSNGTEKKKKKGALSDDIIEYIKSISLEILKYQENEINSNNTAEVKEDFSILLANVVDELKGLEIHCCRASSCSPVIENILTLCNSLSFKIYVYSLKTYFLELSLTRCGSKILEVILKRIPLLLKEEDTIIIDTSGYDDNNIPPTITEIFNTLLSEFAPNWGELFSNMFGSYVARAVFKVYCVSDLPMDDLVSAIVNTENEAAIIEYAQDPLVSITFQGLLEALCARKSSKTDYVSSTLLSWTTNAPEPNMKNRRVIRHVRQLVCDKSGSRLCEAIVKYSSETLIIRFASEHLVGSFTTLARQSFSNFVLSALFERFCHCEDSINIIPIISAAVDDLMENFDSLLKMNRGAVLWKLFECCAKYNVKTSEISKIIIKAKEQNQEAGTFIDYFLWLNCNGYTDYSPIGTSILCALLKFPVEDSTHIIDSIAACSQDDIYNLCSNKITSHMMEHLFTLKLSKEQNKEIKNKMIGLFADLACNKFGSYIIEKMYLNSKLKDQTVIVDELSISINRLKSNHFGKFIIKTCKIDSYKENSEEWVEKQKSAKKAKEIFAELFEEPKTKETVADEVAPKKSKKDKVKLSLDGANSNEVNNEVEELFSSLKKKRKDDAPQEDKKVKKSKRY